MRFEQSISYRVDFVFFLISIEGVLIGKGRFKEGSLLHDCLFDEVQFRLILRYSLDVTSKFSEIETSMRLDMI